ncbi:MAG: DUF58 domain-containing protein [Pseudomonadota bacterium]
MWTASRAALRRIIDRVLFKLGDSEPGEVLLTARRVFIVPTRPGLAFAVLLLLLFIGAINYSLGLGFALTFFTAGCALVDMYLTAKNLAGLRLAAGRAPAVFAGEPAHFELQVINRSRRDRYAVWLDFQEAGTPRHATDIAAGASGEVLASTASAERGWLAAPRVRLTTRFPLGLFRAWAYWQPDVKALIYPFPEPAGPPLPLHGAASEDGHGQVGLDNFAGIRSYQVGDPMRHLAWRQIARLDPSLGGQLVTKHFEGGATADLRLDFAQLPATMGLELRLSRMAHWVLQAEQRAQPYLFCLGHEEIGPAMGQAHSAACLRALALYGLERPA